MQILIIKKVLILDLINYKKPKNEIAKVSLEFKKIKNISNIKKT